MESTKRTKEMTTQDAIFLSLMVLVMIFFVVGGIFLLKWLSSGASSNNKPKPNPKKNKSKETKSKESHASKNLKAYLNSKSSNGSKSSKSSFGSKKKKDKFENVLNNEDKIVGFNINYLNNYANV
jgi:cytoskeletal protein RodZ